MLSIKLWGIYETREGYPIRIIGIYGTHIVGIYENLDIDAWNLDGTGFFAERNYDLVKQLPSRGMR